MFYDANEFNQDIGNWNTSSGETAIAMFKNAYDFNCGESDFHTKMLTENNTLTLASGATYVYFSWNTENMNNFAYMFDSARKFNGDIGNWNTENINNIKQDGTVGTYKPTSSSPIDFDYENAIGFVCMFRNALIFGKTHSSFTDSYVDIRQWHVKSNINFSLPTSGGSYLGSQGYADMSHMFKGATEFSGKYDSSNSTFITAVNGHPAASFFAFEPKNDYQFRQALIYYFSDGGGILRNALSLTTYGTGPAHNFDDYKNIGRTGQTGKLTAESENLISYWWTKNVTRMDYAFWAVLSDGYTGTVNFGNTSVDEIPPASLTPGPNETQTGWFFNPSVGPTSIHQYKNLHLFDIDISNWDTSNVTNMNFMFAGRFDIDGLTPTHDLPTAFNGNLGIWDTSNVIYMRRMFFYTTEFNYDINTKVVRPSGAIYTAWDVSKVEKMNEMFGQALKFNEELDNWNTGNCTDMSFMFYNASEFNKDINSWDTSSVTNMSGMFSYATNFNGIITAWDVSQVSDLSGMFDNADKFNQNISVWNVSNCSKYTNMFNNARHFDQNLGNWTLGPVITGGNGMDTMFNAAFQITQTNADWTGTTSFKSGMLSNIFQFYSDGTNYDGVTQGTTSYPKIF